ncbi:MAG: DUF1223 domain-containing protein [Pseudomonadota bacterium]
MAMLHRILLPALMALSLLAAPAVRAEQPVLVELFTSQGCSSCPPADRLLGELAKDRRVVALSFHVDYWDYLGWKDTFASRANTQRQGNYVGMTDRSGIRQRLRGKFTPEVVVQGTHSFVGHDRLQIAASIVEHSGAAERAVITLAGGRATLTPKAAGLPETRVLLARFDPEASVEIARGENAGRTISYHHVVTELSELGTWTGDAEMAIEIPGSGSYAVFLQEGPAGPILAAASTR